MIAPTACVELVSFGYNIEIYKYSLLRVLITLSYNKLYWQKDYFESVMENIGVLNVGGCSGVTEKTRPRVTIGVARYGSLVGCRAQVYILYISSPTMVTSLYERDVKQQTDKQTKSWWLA